MTVKKVLTATAVFAFSTLLASSADASSPQVQKYLEIDFTRAEVLVLEVDQYTSRVTQLFGAKAAMPQYRTFLTPSSGVLHYMVEKPTWTPTSQQRQTYPGLKAHYPGGSRDNPLGNCQIVIELFNGSAPQYIHIYGKAGDEDVGRVIQGGYVRVQDAACSDLIDALSGAEPIVEIID